jgi:DNA-binding transcriptional LysR family regulator
LGDLHTFWDMPVELRHLRYIIAVAEEGHITRAAELLGIQQPPLSRLIKAIEQETKIQLFRRVPRGVELTDAGRTFVEGARATFAHLDRTLESARRTARGEEGRISLAVTSSAGFQPLVPQAIRAFHEKFPRVTVTLAVGGRPEAIEGLQSNRFDAAFFWTNSGKPESLVFHQVLEGTLVVALPEGHPLARGRTEAALPLKALSDETFVVSGRSGTPSAQLRAIFAACQAAGFTPRVGQETQQVVSVLPLVAAAIGIAIVPAAMQQMDFKGVIYRPLAVASQFKVPLYLASRRGDTSTVLREFVNLVRRRAKNYRNNF